MKDHEFHAIVDQYFQHIEDVVDQNYPDIDCERAGGLLSLSFENRSKIIVNKQEPLHQIWVATQENGFHFDLTAGGWIDNRFGQELGALLSDAASKQAGEAVSFL
ncbi:MAG: iron donor protein CyaY [Aeromonas sp.]